MYSLVYYNYKPGKECNVVGGAWVDPWAISSKAEYIRWTHNTCSHLTV